MARKISIILSILVVLYLGIGLAFHFKWKSALAACRETRKAQGEFVEPEVFGGILGLVFDVTNWPVYSWANIYHDGTPFATPCTKIPNEPSSTDEANHVEYVVGNFGKRLQNVWLQSPNAAQDMREQYSEFVSPALLETWVSDVSKSPGRIVSSPWTDRIEITALANEGSNRYREQFTTLLQTIILKMAEVQIGQKPPPPFIEILPTINAIPTMIVMAGQDDFERRVYARYTGAAGASVEFWLIENAHHTSGPALDPDEYRRRMLDFFQAALIQK